MTEAWCCLFRFPKTGAQREGILVKNLLEFQRGCPVDMNSCPLLKEMRRLEEECKKLRDLSHIDDLTGFYNFRYLTLALETEMERTRRSGLPTSLIMIDLDHFKEINDTYGHECGNQALRWAASVWRENIRRIDIPCRYGGEEFSIILPGTRIQMALKAAERLRSELSQSPILLDGHEIVMTASFGVDSYQLGEAFSAKALVKRTDRYLLQAKEMGRDRVCCDEARLSALGETQVTEEERDILIPKPRPGDRRKDA
jgi:diguanylate cyclase (GGDEF)-like protein